ncbi:hypothetical protein PHMEG_0006904 [Phytophthora megakarya]|uniref:Uncharacterized protein n=1 Tax=Phytophthora megakarya TaxID=4795 RepID=A0A225WPY3_9STRA|nr:hypothetical protein PHMEG_0006904 [Phytophthora megakarya]
MESSKALPEENALIAEVCGGSIVSTLEVSGHKSKQLPDVETIAQCSVPTHTEAVETPHGLQPAVTRQQ